MSIPTHCVVDTNVAVVANGSSADDEDGASFGSDCVAASARALQVMMKRGHLFVDDDGLIVDEYRRNLAADGQRGPGDAFLKWVLTNEWSDSRITRVRLTSAPDRATQFEELDDPLPGVTYDPSDCKFLAVAVAHQDHPAILQSMDSKWWGWVESLHHSGVDVHFLCAMEIEAKYREKMEK